MGRRGQEIRVARRKDSPEGPPRCSALEGRGGVKAGEPMNRSHLEPLREGQQALTFLSIRRKNCDSLEKDKTPEHQRFSRVNSSLATDWHGLASQSTEPTSFPGLLPHPD